MEKTSLSLATLARHFAAHADAAVKARDYDTVVTLRRLAVGLALDRFAGNVDEACAWLVEAGFGDGTIMGLRAYVQNKREGLRLRTSAR